MGSSMQNNQNNTSDQSIKEELTESSIDTTVQSYQTPVKHELGKDPAVDSPTDVPLCPVEDRLLTLHLCPIKDNGSRAKPTYYEIFYSLC